MGVEHKHSYRFVFLRSEEWKDVRYEALAREKSRCQICNDENFNNDAHHAFYPKNIWDTEAEDLIILCRPCHELAQALFIQQSTREKGILKFNQIVATIQKWLKVKSAWACEKMRSDSKLRKKIIKDLVPPGMESCNACRKFGVPLSNAVAFEVLKIDLSQPSPQWKLCDECKLDLSNLDCSELKNFPKGSIHFKNNVFKIIRIWNEKREASNPSFQLNSNS